MFDCDLIKIKVVQWEVDSLRGTSIYKRVEEMRVAVEGRYKWCIGTGLLNGVIDHHFKKAWLNCT